MKKYRPGMKPKFPMASIALYGPDNKRATKTVVGIINRDGGEVEDLHRWISPDIDIRKNPVLQREIAAFLKERSVKMTIMADRIIGCPHEEGKDYPEGEACPMCPFWANRNRWTGEVES